MAHTMKISDFFKIKAITGSDVEHLFSAGNGHAVLKSASEDPKKLAIIDAISAADGMEGAQFRPIISVANELCTERGLTPLSKPDMLSARRAFRIFTSTMRTRSALRDQIFE